MREIIIFVGARGYFLLKLRKHLVLFSGFGRKDIVEYLLDAGADVHARDDGGLIPLHNACSFGHVEVTLSLLRHNADVNARDNWNFTPLHEAAIKGKVEVCIGEENTFYFFLD